MQKQYEIVPNYQFLIIDFLKVTTEKLFCIIDKILFPNLTIIKNAGLASELFRNLKMFGNLKFKNSNSSIVQLFDLMWLNNAEFKLKFGANNWISFEFGYLNWFYKKLIELKKVNTAQKLHYWNILSEAIFQ
jgi:hypothetical protein